MSGLQVNTSTLKKVVLVRRGKCERDKSKRTEIHDISLELFLNLRPSSYERCPVRSISGAAFVDLNGFGILDMPNVAVELDVRPFPHDLIMEGLEIGDSFVLVVQFASSPPNLSRFPSPAPPSR